MTREELTQKIHSLMFDGTTCQFTPERAADFILSTFTEKPRPLTVQERLQNLINANIPDVWRDMSRGEFLGEFSKNVLKFGAGELKDILAQYEREQCLKRNCTCGPEIGACHYCRSVRR